MPRRYRPPSKRRKSGKGRLRQDAEAPSYEDIRRPTSSPSPAAPQERSSQVGQIARDYSYVLGDLRRIAVIVAFITVGLIITAILR